MLRCFGASALCASISLVSAAAAGQEPERWGDAKAAAEALFEEGVALGEKGQWQEACKKLEASQTLDVAVGTLLRLADCYERVGKLASAWARFREARSLAQAQGMADRERIATLRADALDPKMARLTLTVPALPPPGFELTLGETPVPRASWGSALPIDAGSVAVEARAPGYITFRRTVTVPTTSGARLIVAIPALEAETPPPVAPMAPAKATPRAPRRTAKGDSDAGYTARALGVTFAVVGGVGLATGGALAILSSKRNDESLEQCPNSPRLCTTRGVQLREDATTLADMATVSAAVGGGLVATGIIVYAVGARQRPRETVALDVTPDLARTGLTLRARGTF